MRYKVGIMKVLSSFTFQSVYYVHDTGSTIARALIFVEKTDQKERIISKYYMVASSDNPNLRARVNSYW